MSYSGDSSMWAKLFPPTLIPAIIDLVLASWKRLPTPAADELEDRITRKLAARMINRKDRSEQPFLIIAQSEVLNHSTGGLLGRIDVRIFHGWREEVYFAFECKRLNVRRNGARHSLSGEYAEKGMARFVTGKYAGGLDSGGMLGYVMDGDLKSAMAAVKKAIEARRAKLCMDSNGTLAVSSLRPKISRVKQTSHQQAGKPFLIHHVFLPVG